MLAGHELTVSGSAGIALYPEDGETGSELLRKADAAMYRAKDEGRNTWRFFSAEINTASLGELLLENDLFGALEREELLLHYQPKVCAKTGDLVGAVQRAIHDETGIDTELSTTGGTSDGRFIAQVCPQVIELGPPNASIHKINEHVAVADLDPLKNIYRRVLENLDKTSA